MGSKKEKLKADILVLAEKTQRGLSETPEQREDMFRARKSWRKNTYKRRESILETERRCVNDARTMDAFEACRNETKNSKRALRAEFRDYINPLRRRVGLPPLEEKRNMRRMDNDQGRRA